MREIMAIIIVFLILHGFGDVSANQGEVITTRSGNVSGIIQPSSLSGSGALAFHNIPYAEAPVGELRFAKPQPRKPWNGTLNSTTDKIACLQPAYVAYEPGLVLTEDCLILNVWTPYPRPKNASVMVWIHGGAFQFGHADSYVGLNFVAVGDVILVTINYRLTALGFLTTGDDRIKGNLGLFDQRLALKWVKENIAAFGGNPNSITIFGESAGGASVSAHTISKGSWPYFHRAILQSGSMLMPWAVMTDSQIKDGMKWFLRKVNCSDDENLLSCLRNVTADKMRKVLTSKEVQNIWMGPAVDGEFFSHHPRQLLEKGEVKNDDVILGITRDESFASYVKLLKQKNGSVYAQHFEKLLKTIFKNSSKKIYEKARELYKQECASDSYIEALKPLVALESDTFFICPTRHEAKIRPQLLNTTNVYLYQYSHTPLVPYFPVWYPYGTFDFAAHGLDEVSVFGLPINNTIFLTEDQTLSMRMILYWTNFAKTGDPNLGTTKLPLVLDKVDTLPRWPKHTSSDEEYLDMESLSRMVVKKKLREKHCEFLLKPEEFVKNGETNGSRRNIFATHAWLLIPLLYFIFM